MNPIVLPDSLKQTIGQGGIIAYPTESVYGLGCDPFNEAAVRKLAQLKQRALHKGFIVIASNWQQIEALIAPLSDEQMQRLKASWPGPITWVCPCSTMVPAYLRGEHVGIAVRITDHPVARAICDGLQQAIISTSANISDHAPARNATALKTMFGDAIDLIIEGEVGGSQKPTPIRDMMSGHYWRE